MGFIAAKIAMYLLLPPSGMLLLVALGLFLSRWHRKSGRSLIALGFILLYIASLPAVADMLIRPLESYSKPFTGTTETVDAVVVLGCGVRDLSWIPAPPAPTDTAIGRLVKGIEIARRLKVPLVLSGGSGDIAGSSVREANAMADVALRLGFPRKSIVIDNSSRNTLENVEAVSALLPGKRIVLVTSAFHMRRASAMFHKKGFTVIPAPTAYLAGSRPRSLTSLIPHADVLAVSSTALSERLSLFWYGMLGTI